MALSSVQIGRLALSMVGADTSIESLTEASAEAKTVNLWFEHSKEQTLAGYNWSFAKDRVALIVHADDPPGEWAYRYIYPADCIKIRSIENPLSKTDDPSPFVVELSSGTKSVLTDVEDATVIFTRNITDTFLFTPYFIETWATVIGSHIGFDLTGKDDINLTLAEQARRMLIFASSIDASEKQEDPAREAVWIRGRD